MAVAADGGPHARSRSTRLTGLDVVRGLAAMSVLVYHALLTVPALAEPQTHGFVADWTWVVSHTPLRVLWSGGAAVTLFFVLSGFVLTLAMRQPGAPSWAEYYPRRLLRLYLPVAGAVILATFWITLAPRASPADATTWLRGFVTPTGTGIVKDLALVWAPGSTTSVLWSLTWEVLFSLLLPLYLLVVVRTTRWAVIGIVASIGLSVLGQQVGSTALTFLPVFAVGCYVAALQDRLPVVVQRWWSAERPAHRVVCALVLAQGFSLPFLLTGLGLSSAPWRAVGSTVLLLSCAAIVAVGAVVPAPADGSFSRSLRWLGSRSFSIYLVHEPIIVSVALVGAESISEWWTLPIGLPISLLVAEAFYRVVERPVTNLARGFVLPGRLRQRELVS